MALNSGGPSGQQPRLRRRRTAQIRPMLAELHPGGYSSCTDLGIATQPRARLGLWCFKEDITFRRTLGVIVLGLVGTGLAAAQERVPHTGSTAVGVDFGAFIPKESQLETAPIVNVLIEYYFTPRLSIRTGFGLTDPGFSRESTDSLRQVPLHFDVNYNWEGGKWHPFVGAGAGAYFLQPKDNGRSFVIILVCDRLSHLSAVTSLRL